MKVKRVELIKVLTAVLPGTERLGGGGVDRVLFDKEWLRSFNDNISVSHPYVTDFEVGVKADELCKILQRMKTEEVELNLEEDGKFVVSSKRTKLRMSALPQEDFQKMRTNILSLVVDKWASVPKGFAEALPLTLITNSKEQRLGKIAGVAFLGKDVVCTDNYKVSHYKMESPIADELFRVKLAAVENLVRLKKGYEFVAINNNWLNLKAKDGMIISTRMLPAGDYPINDILGVFEKLFDLEAKDYEFPKELEDALSVTEVLSAVDDEDFGTITIFEKIGGELVLTAKQPFAEVEERLPWDGELPGKFFVTPGWIRRVLKITRKFKVSTARRTIMFEAPNFQYMVLTKKA